MERWGNVQIAAYIRNLLNLHGLDWTTCEEIGKEVQELFDNVETFSDDKGNQWNFDYIHEENMRKARG